MECKTKDCENKDLYSVQFDTADSCKTILLCQKCTNKLIKKLGKASKTIDKLGFLYFRATKYDGATSKYSKRGHPYSKMYR